MQIHSFKNTLHIPKRERAPWVRRAGSRRCGSTSATSSSCWTRSPSTRPAGSAGSAIRATWSRRRQGVLSSTSPFVYVWDGRKFWGSCYSCVCAEWSTRRSPRCRWSSMWPGPRGSACANTRGPRCTPTSTGCAAMTRCSSPTSTPRSVRLPAPAAVAALCSCFRARSCASCVMLAAVIVGDEACVAIGQSSIPGLWAMCRCTDKCALHPVDEALAG